MRVARGRQERGSGGGKDRGDAPSPEWFERIGTHMALWSISVGRVPPVPDAEERLAHLQEDGPAPCAFTFKMRSVADAEVIVDEELGCPA